MRWAALQTGLCLLVTTAWCAETEPQYTSIAYPLELNFCQDEGTVELWVRPDSDLTADAGDRFYHFFAWRIALGLKTWGEEGAFGLIWRSPQGLYTFGGRAHADVTLRNTPTVWPRKLPWQPGSWHHLAFTWHGHQMTLFADGVQVARAKASERIPSADRGYWVVGFGHSPIAVDEFVVSSVARSGEEILERMQHRCERDEFTLILDPMETLDRTHARCVGPDPERCRLVAGRFGRALQLYR